ncbi:MAG: hypothetical protein PWQ15_716 [Methanobacterium sp.]|uniref:DUF1616 domain-containing protein n=1 Tax=Methanobacterium sp. TaxID=2164 RepID=UPI0024AAB449|nr:DUF1616 domain-containing protein [Methanobacterium sp.]MDI3549614.1 hypothetical protein [Methanobacterium sp.]
MNIDRTISIIILIFIVVGIIGIFYLWLNSNEVESYTEFYLLGQSGKASDYPTNLSVNQKASITVGIVNHEYSKTSYLLKITKNNEILKEENFTLENNQNKSIPFDFKAETGQYKIKFDLYKLPDTQNVYRSLFLLVNVN